jgi:hypothetical protein
MGPDLKFHRYEQGSNICMYLGNVGDRIELVFSYIINFLIVFLVVPVQ